MRLQVLCQKENPVLPPRLSQLLINNHLAVTVQLLLYRHWIATVRPLLRFLTKARVIELCLEWDYSRWKAKTRGYKFSVGRRTQFCPLDFQNCSSRNMWLLLSRHWTVTVRALLRFLTISRLIELRFEWDWSRWKAKTRGYKFSVGRRTQFCPLDYPNCSSTTI
jgi:hypothetical protein